MLMPILDRTPASAAGTYHPNAAVAGEFVGYDGRLSARVAPDLEGIVSADVYDAVFLSHYNRIGRRSPIVPSVRRRPGKIRMNQ